MAAEDYEELLTIWNTLILDLQVLVRPRTRIWKDIGAGDNDALRPVVTSAKQTKIGSQRVSTEPRGTHQHTNTLSNLFQHEGNEIWEHDF